METVGETVTTTQDAPQTTGQPSEQKKEVPQPRTFTEEETKKQVSDALAEQGRRHKTELDSTRQETQEKISALEAELEEMAQDDPDRKRLTARIKELDEREKKLKADRESQDAEWTSKQERLQRAEETNFEIDLWDLCEQFDGADAMKLKTACTRAKITDIEGAKALAEVLWTKKSSEAIPLTEGEPDSGETSGGSNPSITEVRRKYIEGKFAKELGENYELYAKEIRRLGAEP